MTPIKATEMRARYERQHGKDHKYTYWTATRELTKVPDELDITAFVVFKSGEVWCWGMAGDVESIKKWRWDNRHLSRPLTKAAQRRLARERGELPDTRFAHKVPKRKAKWPRRLESKTQAVMFETANLVDAGYTTSEIAQKLDIPYEKIYYYVKKYQRDPHLFVDRYTEQV